MFDEIKTAAEIVELYAVIFIPVIVLQVFLLIGYIADKWRGR